MTDHDEMVLRIEAAMERFEERQLRMRMIRGRRQRLCAVSGCHRCVLMTERFCVIHMTGINPLTIHEKTMRPYRETKVQAGPFMGSGMRNILIPGGM